MRDSFSQQFQSCCQKFSEIEIDTAAAGRCITIEDSNTIEIFRRIPALRWLKLLYDVDSSIYLVLFSDAQEDDGVKWAKLTLHFRNFTKSAGRINVTYPDDVRR